jgi:hypothetical protein
MRRVLAAPTLLSFSDEWPWDSNRSSASHRLSLSALLQATFAMAIDRLPNNKADGRFDDIVAMWELDTLESGRKQRSIYQHPDRSSFRIDRQSNGDFWHLVAGQEVRYRNIAVQDGDDVYASVDVPLDIPVGRGLIRWALIESRDRRAVVRIVPQDTGLTNWIPTTLLWAALASRTWWRASQPTASFAQK